MSDENESNIGSLVSSHVGLFLDTAQVRGGEAIGVGVTIAGIVYD